VCAPVKVFLWVPYGGVRAVGVTATRDLAIGSTATTNRRAMGPPQPKEPHGRRSAGLSRGSMKRLMGALARPGLTRRTLNRVPCP